MSISDTKGDTEGRGNNRGTTDQIEGCGANSDTGVDTRDNNRGTSDQNKGHGANRDNKGRTEEGLRTDRGTKEDAEEREANMGAEGDAVELAANRGTGGGAEERGANKNDQIEGCGANRDARGDDTAGRSAVYDRAAYIQMVDEIEVKIITLAPHLYHPILAPNPNAPHKDGSPNCLIA